MCLVIVGFNRLVVDLNVDFLPAAKRHGHAELLVEKNKEKKGLKGFLVCLVVDFQYFQLFSFFH